MTDDELESAIKDEFSKVLPRMKFTLRKRECSFGVAFSARTEIAVDVAFPAEETEGNVRCRIRQAAQHVAEFMFESCYEQLIPGTMLALSRPLNDVVAQFIKDGINPFSTMHEPVVSR